jgi:hypothetical protein
MGKKREDTGGLYKRYARAKEKGKKNGLTGGGK